MVFSSALFLFGFLPLALAAYFAAPRVARNGVLLALSLAFYVWGERTSAWVLPLSIAGNYLAGLWVVRSRSPGRVLAVAVAANLLLLATFKYAGFLADNLNPLLGLVGLPALDPPALRLPAGISFFTFQAISYLVDVSRRDVPAERSPVRYALYAALFPHLIAGPIVRYRDLAGRLRRRRVTVDGFAEGARRFVLGLGQKVLLADTLQVAADEAFAVPPAELGAAAAWLGLVCYGLQIYFDFAGYSGMAIGLGRMFGFRFAENFRHPYAAAGVAEFWRRWHITLSEWLRDYVYRPLGGSRRGPGRAAVNVLVVFALCGLWHGAAWTFVVWGLWHGALVAAEHAGLGRALAAAGRPVRHGYTLVAVLLGWVWFRADSFGHAAGYFAALAGGGTGDGFHLADVSRDIWLALAAGVVASVPAGVWLNGWRIAPAWRAAAAFAGCVAVFAGAVLCLAAGAYQPFLYWRF